jgi:hypothetical protein
MKPEGSLPPSFMQVNSRFGVRSMLYGFLSLFSIPTAENVEVQIHLLQSLDFVYFVCLFVASHYFTYEKL